MLKAGRRLGCLKLAWERRRLAGESAWGADTLPADGEADSPARRRRSQASLGQSRGAGIGARMNSRKRAANIEKSRVEFMRFLFCPAGFPLQLGTHTYS